MNNTKNIFALILATLATTHIDTHAAAPASASSSSSSSSNRLALPILTPAQKEKLDAFKKTHRFEVNIPTTTSIFNLVIQDNIHPDYVRYGKYDQNCALGWAIGFPRNLVLARYLLEHGANPNSLHKSPHTHVLLAARSVKDAQLLLDYKADIKACAKDLLPTTIGNLFQRDPKLIAFYIKQGVDPDLIDGTGNWHPMCSLACYAFSGAKKQECAQYLIEGGVSLSYKIKKGEWRDYTPPLILKQKLLSDQKDYTDTQAFITHVKQLADDRRKNIHALVAQHLPVANKNKINGETFPLADLVTDYYEPEFDQMYNEPFPPK